MFQNFNHFMCMFLENNDHFSKKILIFLEGIIRISITQKRIEKDLLRRIWDVYVESLLKKFGNIENRKYK